MSGSQSASGFLAASLGSETERFNFTTCENLYHDNTGSYPRPGMEESDMTLKDETAL
jgi:hypothetical protein